MRINLVGEGPHAKALAAMLVKRLSGHGHQLNPTPTAADIRSGEPTVVLAFGLDPASLQNVIAGIKPRVKAVLGIDTNLPSQLARRLSGLQAATCRNFSIACDLIDHGARCALLPDSEPEKLEMHAAIITAIARREAGDRPAVSFVVPVFNPPLDYFRATVRSALGQDDPDLELVLLDNGDPKKSAPVIREIDDPRVSYYGGMGGRNIAMGRNLGNMLARGRIICVLDHDDAVAPDRARMTRQALAGKNALVYSDVYQVFPDQSRELKKLKQFSKEEVWRGCNIYHPSVAYPWELACGVPYDPRFEPADDYHFFLAVLRSGRKLIHLPKPLLYYSRHPAQHSRTAMAKMDAATVGVKREDEYLRQGGDPSDRQARFHQAVLALIGKREDEKASMLIALGHAEPRLADILAAASGAGLPDNAAQDSDMAREAAWVFKERGQTASAIRLLERALDKNVLNPLDQSNLACVLFMDGRIQKAAERARAALGRGETALAPHILLAVENWRQQAGERKPLPHQTEPTSGDKPLFDSAAIAGGKYLAFREDGDEWRAGFHEQAAARLDSTPNIEAIVGRIGSPVGPPLPDRAIPLSALLRDERARIAGLVVRREALSKVGGFIPELGEAAAWEFMIRLYKKLRVITTDLDAGKSARPPLLSAPRNADEFKNQNALALTVKLIHSPISHMDLLFGDAVRQVMCERLEILKELGRRAPVLFGLIDPWEFMASYNIPYHLLYRLSGRLAQVGLKSEARICLKQALRLKPFEPKLWFRIIGLRG